MISRVAIARAVAIGADAVQMGLFPVFFEGLGSVLDAALDVVVCGVLTWLVGWHIAFLPGFLLEGLPFVDLAPTWTIAIFIATRKKNSPPTSSPPVMDVPALSVPPKIVGQLEESKMEKSESSPPAGNPASSRSEWPRAIMWITIAAIFAGSSLYVFHSCVEAPARYAGKLTERVTDAARELAAAFVKGTVTTQFHEYCTEVHPNLSLQVATLKEVEQFTRSDEAVIGNIPLPEIIVSVTAPVEYIYHLSLNDKWEFNLKGDLLTVRVPELRVNNPSFDVSNMKWEVQKDSLIRNTSRVKEELRQSLMPLAISRGHGHVNLVRETARTQVTAFVEKWLRDRFHDGKQYRVEVYFENERLPATPAPNSKRDLPVNYAKSDQR